MTRKKALKRQALQEEPIIDINFSTMKRRVIKEINSDKSFHKTLIIPICFPQPNPIADYETHANTLKNLRQKSDTIYVGLIDDDSYEHRGVAPNDIQALLHENFLKSCGNHHVKIYLSGHSDTSYFELYDEIELFEILEPLLQGFSVTSITLDSCHTADSFEKKWRMEKMMKWTTPPNKDHELAERRLAGLDIGQENLTKRLSRKLVQERFCGIEVRGFRGEIYHSFVDHHGNKSSKYRSQI